MENFTPTPYTLECVATGREFEDAGWMLADPQCKEPSLVRTKYARKRSLPVLRLDARAAYPQRFVGSRDL